MKTEEKTAEKNESRDKKTEPKNRIKSSILVVSVIAFVFVLFSVFYFNLMLPVLNVLYNPAENPVQEVDGPEVNSGNVIDINDPYYKDPNSTPGYLWEDDTPTPDTGTTPGPETTEGGKATPEPTSSTGESPTAEGTPDPYNTPFGTDSSDPTPDNTPSGSTAEPTLPPTSDPTAGATDQPPDPTPFNGISDFGIVKVTDRDYMHASQVVFEEGTKNVLLLGFNPKDNLCDSIFILNINTRSKVIKVVSVPRDTYVPHSETTKEALRSRKIYDSPGIHKINATVYIGNHIIKYTGGKFTNRGINFICAILSALLPGCDIDDYIYVDFDGFMDIIDVVGGVYVTSPENMYTDRGELVIKEGLNKLNAKDALFYVRYRKRLDSTGKDTFTGSDNWRKLNQANFIAEVATQIIKKENLTLSHVTETLDVLKQSVFHSITPDKLGEYLAIGRDFADKKYTVQLCVIKGYTIDPFGDHAWYSQLD